MATKEQRQNKQFVEKLIQIQGLDYDEWLDKIHVEYMTSNNKLILEALDSKLNKRQTEDKKENETASNTASANSQSSNQNRQ